MTWLTAALLSAFFAGITAVLATVGVKDVNSNLATAIRTAVILIFAWGIVFFQGTQKQLAGISPTSLLFLILSAIATGLSWLFYFRALQLGGAAKVAPIDKLSLVFTIIMAAVLLREKITWPILFGSLLVSLGAIITTL